MHECSFSVRESVSRSSQGLTRSIDRSIDVKQRFEWKAHVRESGALCKCFICKKEVNRKEQQWNQFAFFSVEVVRLRFDCKVRFVLD